MQTKIKRKQNAIEHLKDSQLEKQQLELSTTYVVVAVYKT